MHRLTKTAIFIDRMRVYARHGVMEQEGVVGGSFEVSVRVDYDYSRAMKSDALVDTISYSNLCNIIKREMAIPSKLVEHAACRIAEVIIHTYPHVSKVKIRIVKVNPPMEAETDGAGVEIEFSL